MPAHVPTRAYDAGGPPAGGPRRTEAWALTEAARRLHAARTGQPFDAAALESALRLNWRLWTIFQAEMNGPDCRLPPELRATLLSLSLFVDETTVTLLRQSGLEQAPDSVSTLITINRELASGLLATPPGPERGGSGPVVDCQT